MTYVVAPTRCSYSNPTLPMYFQYAWQPAKLIY